MNAKNTLTRIAAILALAGVACSASALTLSGAEDSLGTVEPTCTVTSVAAKQVIGTDSNLVIIGTTPAAPSITTNASSQITWYMGEPVIKKNGVVQTFAVETLTGYGWSVPGGNITKPTTNGVSVTFSSMPEVATITAAYNLGLVRTDRQAFPPGSYEITIPMTCSY